MENEKNMSNKKTNTEKVCQWMKGMIKKCMKCCKCLKKSDGIYLLKKNQRKDL